MIEDEDYFNEIIKDALAREDRKNRIQRFPTGVTPKINKKTFMTRADFMANIDIPKSTAQKIVIPSNSKGDSFSSNCYHKEYLESVITKE